MNSNLAVWWNVPNGATVELWVLDEDGDGDFLAGARVLRSDEIEWHIFHKHLDPGPTLLPVANDLSYGIRYLLVFQGEEAQIATFHVRVKSASGKRIPDSNGNKEYVYHVQGKAGDLPARATIMVMNKEGMGGDDE